MNRKHQKTTCLCWDQILWAKGVNQPSGVFPAVLGGWPSGPCLHWADSRVGKGPPSWANKQIRTFTYTKPISTYYSYIIYPYLIVYISIYIYCLRCMGWSGKRSCEKKETVESGRCGERQQSVRVSSLHSQSHQINADWAICPTLNKQELWPSLPPKFFSFSSHACRHWL